ncbi:MAG: preprotein translocase subunit SecE [Calditrichaeota bacterium]|nr:preprotein translocase subunit SecE [Calditrichota bacterium]
MFQKMMKFFRDVKLEMSKVSWPTRYELKGQTTIVIFVSFLFAIFIFLVDQVLSRFINFLY